MILSAILSLALACAQPPAPVELTVSVCGDIMMGTTYPTVRLPENDGANLFDAPREVLKGADLTLGNLEGTLCDGGKSTKGDGKNSYSFRTPVSYAKNLKEAGFDYLSMANNHSNDFGETGLNSTERALDGQGIGYSGVEGRREWYVLERKGIRIGICAFGHNSYTIKHTSLPRVKEILDTLGKISDVVVVSFHGGAEGADKEHLPRGSEIFLGEDRGDLRNLAHFCVDNGADLVYGHGPHVCRGMEVYKSRFIVYSLGNFCTPYGMSLTGVKAYAPVITVRIRDNGAFVEGKIHPFIQQSGKGPLADSSGEVIRRLKYLSESDLPESSAKIDLEGNIRRK